MGNGFDGIGVARTQAQVAVRCLGDATVQLNLPAPPVAGDVGEELGLRAPEFQTLMLSPVAVRHLSCRTEIRVAAPVLESALGVVGMQAVHAAMSAVTSAQVQDGVFAIAGVDEVLSGGDACMYRLLLQPQIWEVG